jgi:hypothetical protein
VYLRGDQQHEKVEVKQEREENGEEKEEDELLHCTDDNWTFLSLHVIIMTFSMMKVT